MRPWILGLAIAVATSSGTAAQPGRFRSGVDLVNFGVMVLDRQGKFITNLEQGDFAVFEDGRPQDVNVFYRGDTDADAQHLRLGLLFDTSGSMTDDIAFALSAAIKFLNEMREAVDITLVDFDTEVRVARYNQADFPRLVERIRGRKPDGWTALYDALGIYLAGVHEREGRKVLVVYTDGGDTRSAVTFADVLEMLRMADVTVYAIGFLEHQSSSHRNEQKMRLRQITEVTGGEAFFPASTKVLDEVYAKILAQVRAQYNLGFISSNAKKDGTWRAVEVKLTAPHLQHLRVRARRGYFAPLADAIRSVDAAGQPH